MKALRVALGAFVVAVAVMTVALSIGGGAPQPAPPGLPDPGAFTGWALPTVRLLADFSVIAVIGFLLAAVVLIPGTADVVEGRAVDAVRLAMWSALAWGLGSLAEYVLFASDLFARPVPTLNLTLLTELSRIELGRGLLVQTVVGLVLAAVLRWTLRVSSLAVLLGVALAGLVPQAASGHSASSGSHDFAGVSLIFHLVGVTVWVGGLFALAWLAWRGSKRLPASIDRFSHLALWAFVVVGLSGLFNTAVRLRGPDDLFGTAYGRLVLAKIAALVVLGAFGWIQRRRASSFLRVAVSELVVMAATIGLAVGLGRTPTPLGDVLRTPAEELLGGPLPPAPTLGRLLWGWTPSGIGIALVLGGAALYLTGVLVLRRRGDRWPVGRTVAWGLGLVAIAWATFGGLGVYSHVLFSAHMVSHMVLSMVAPILLVLGAPVTLALRALPGPRQPGEVSPRALLTAFLHSRWSRFITHPLVGPVIFIGSLFGLYYTPLFGRLMASHWGHALMELHFLAAGVLFAYVIVGVDPAPRRPQPLVRFGILMFTVPFHAFFSIALMSSSEIFAETYWRTLDRPYRTDLLADQYLGGGIAWAMGEVPLILMMLALFAQWVRDDARSARRKDRQADRDDDAELEAYNARLREMAEKGKRREP